MRGLLLAIVTCTAWVAFAGLVPAEPPTSATLKITVQGDTSRLPDFIASLRREFAERSVNIDVVSKSGGWEYDVVVAQETTFGSAAAAVIVLDRDCNLVASVVRSGRFSGKGALNACAKELAKKIVALRGTT